MKIINPATAEIIKDIPSQSHDEIESTFSVLKENQKSWQKVPVSERVNVIRKFKALLEENIESLSADLSAEVGKPIQQSRNEINGACHRIQFFIDHSEKTLSETIQYEDDTVQEVLAFEPLGVICNISAWNYPYLVGVNVIIPALIAGNTVCYKPSEFATMTGLNIERLLFQAGIPNHVFTTVVGDSSVGEKLLSLDFDGFFFTGSHKTGQHIAKQVAHKLVPIGLELGGKDPAYVRADVKDIKAAAEATADGAFYNNGQSCCAVERIYIHENIAEEFTHHFIETVKALDIAPLTREAQILVLENQVQDAISKGAKLLVGGKRVDQPGYYFEPTVLSNVDHSMLVMTEESFGPIIGIQVVRNDDEAIELMNDTPYGLTASVYTAEYEAAKPIMDKLNTGTVYFNCCDRVSPHLPWAGRKHSGLGATLSYLGIQTFVNPKSYHVKK